MKENYFEVHTEFYDYEHSYNVIKRFDLEEDFNNYLKHVNNVLLVQNSNKSFDNSYWTKWKLEEFGWGILYKPKIYKIQREELCCNKK